MYSIVTIDFVTPFNRVFLCAESIVAVQFQTPLVSQHNTVQYFKHTVLSVLYTEHLDVVCRLFNVVVYCMYFSLLFLQWHWLQRFFQLCKVLVAMAIHVIVHPYTCTSIRYMIQTTCTQWLHWLYVLYNLHSNNKILCSVHMYWLCWFVLLAK